MGRFLEAAETLIRVIETIDIALREVCETENVIVAQKFEDIDVKELPHDGLTYASTTPAELLKIKGALFTQSAKLKLNINLVKSHISHSERVDAIRASGDMCQGAKDLYIRDLCSMLMNELDASTMAMLSVPASRAEL